MREYVQALSDILLKMGALDKDNADAIKKDFKGSEQVQLNYFLLDEGLVTKEELLRALSEYYEVPYFDVRGYQFNHDLLSLFPQDFLIRNAVIPVEFDGNILTVVAGGPDQTGLREKLRKYTTHHIEFRVGIVRDIIDEARAYYELPPDEMDVEREDEEEEESTEDIVDLY
ncbi:TPA: hypothetical protein DIC20_02490 [Candidatus Dependentiae bacterium]|nr:MAG: Type II secretion system protein E [candidate division TM6 bacterium GW2011_GWF2_36_131]KKQ03374.1 MAG: Type II secretion system protein E [candidate division TM6 bacterium GW2011_GWE2_36_25]KKQ18945.1 MAG: Type II secretion system protein E [candidate division TM6 bacterium GW2011_GWA2_36_9]HBR70848.1 hypothetical protein [Candidatus Dependentiae bacterium]HCU00549.1 hypothetical protein [Candidatus Dependentiae bacterium]